MANIVCFKRARKTYLFRSTLIKLAVIDFEIKNSEVIGVQAKFDN